MKGILISKGLAVAVIILFIGLAIQPSVATVQTEEEIINIEPKDYLFQTIIDIANNPEVKELLEQYENDIVKVDIDKSVYRKILFRNPRLFSSLIFTKPSMTYDYLNFVYNQGIKIIEIIGEDKTLKIIESVEITDITFFEELNHIISKDDNLSKDIICTIMVVVFFTSFLIAIFAPFYLAIPLYILYLIPNEQWRTNLNELYIEIQTLFFTIPLLSLLILYYWCTGVSPNIK